MKLERILLGEFEKVRYKNLEHQLRRHEICFPGQLCRVTYNDKIHFGIIYDIYDVSESNKLDVHCFVLKEEAGPAYKLENVKIFSHNSNDRITITEIEDETDLSIFKNRFLMFQYMLEQIGKDVRELKLVWSDYADKKDHNNSLTL